ncbi:TPA: hypothetical protein IMJ33_005686 [Salmonella enterica]|nr:hypothetical protein [Salmonella enterica]
MSEYKTTSESTKDITSFWEDVKNLSLATCAPVKASDEDDQIQDMHNKAIETLRNLYFNEINRRAEEVKKQRQKKINSQMLFITVKYGVSAYCGDKDKDYSKIGKAVTDAIINYTNRLYNDGGKPWTTTMEEVVTEDNVHITIQRGLCNDKERLPLPKVERDLNIRPG